MWRLWNKLFGWHYVEMRYGLDQEILRVKFRKNGICTVSYYRDEFILDHNSLAIKLRTGGIRTYIPLTFKPEELLK